jgi:transaldolase
VKLFLDTANIEDIARINRWGVLDGVTTNPTLAAKEGKDFASMIKEICAEVDGPVSAEVVSTDTDEMVERAASSPRSPTTSSSRSRSSPKGSRRPAARGRGHPHQRDPVLLGDAGDPRRPRRRDLRLAVPRALDDIANDGIALLEEICEHLPRAGLRDPGARRVAAPPPARRPGGAGRGGLRDDAREGLRPDGQAPAHRQGARPFLADWDAYQQALRGQA